MDNHNILDNIYIQGKKSTSWKHFGLFYLIQIVTTSAVYLIGRTFKKNSDEADYMGYLSVISTIILSGLMIYFFKNQQKLWIGNKILWLCGLIFVNITCIILLNFLDVPYRISEKQFISSLPKLIKSQVFIWLICLPVVSIIQSRRINKF